MSMEFLHGGITMLFILAGLFFFRFWWEMRDRLFLLFALSFWLQAVTRISLSVVGGEEERTYLYLARLVAFALIIAAIAMKNVSRKEVKSRGAADY